MPKDLERIYDKANKPRLKAVILCLPKLSALNRQDISDSILTEKLLPISKLDPASFTLSLANPEFSLSEVPLCFGSSPSEANASWNFQFNLEILGSSIQYQFTDGQVITVREILYHPYSQFVRADLLPLLRTIKPNLVDHPWARLLPEDSVPPWGNLRQVELILISILLNASLLQNSAHPNGPQALWLTNSQNRYAVRKAFSLNSLQISPQSTSSWHLSPDSEKNSSLGKGAALLKFIEKPLNPKGIILEQFEINPETHTLHFHSCQRQVELVYHSLTNEVSRTSFEKWTKSSPPSFLTFPLVGHSFIHETTKQIDQKLGLLKFPLLHRSGLQNIPTSQIHQQIWIELNGEMRFCRTFRIHDQTFEVWNLSQIANSILNGLQGGLGATSDLDNKLLASDRKGIRRDRDLKILRHAGFFAYLFLEAASYLEASNSGSSKDFSAFFQTLLGRLGNLLYEIEKKSGLIALSSALPLDRVCSPNLIEFLRKYLIQLFEIWKTGTESISTHTGEIHMQEGMKSTFAIFRILVSAAATESNGTCFLKPKMGNFSNFCSDKTEPSAKLNEIRDLDDISNQCPVQDFLVQITSRSEKPVKAQPYNATGQWISSTKLLHYLLPLQNSQFELYYNQLPIDQMNTEDFKPEFHIYENEDLFPNEIGEVPHKKSASSIDWFELHPKFFFKGVEVNSNVLERLSKEGILEFQGKIFLIKDKNLPTIKRLEAFWAKIHGSSFHQGSKKKRSQHFLRLPKNQTLELLALRASGIHIQGGERWQKVCKFYDSLNENRESLSLPRSVKADLKPYQANGVQWLLDLYYLGLGGVLADDMGLGKTVQTLAFLESLRAKNEMGLTLIIVPTSLTYNWLSEADRFTPDLPIQIFQSKNKELILDFLKAHANAALICTYGLFTEHRDFFSKHRWNILIFDEAQNLKNISAKRTTASRNVSAKFKVCLTGTPMENHLGEFFSLLDLAVPGSLGELSEFKAKYVTQDTINPEDLKYLKLKVKPLVLRRTKTEILKELPPKIESVVKLPFEQKQEKIYRDIALSWNEKVKSSILNHGEAKSQILMLTALLRLRQTCSDPASIPHVKYTEEPPKLGVLIEALQEITESGESALVFTQFIHTFSRIKKQLAESKINAFSLHGGTSRGDREKTLKAFQEASGGSVLLMTLKTGGVGLNLVKASYVFHIEPWWNPAVENQASDRAHRLGQLKPVQVYRYLMKESVEEKIEILKERKSSKFNALFSSSESSSDLNSDGTFLSQADFEYLIR